MILPNDGKNKNSLICPRSTIKYKVLVFSTAQSCHLVDKRHISNFFRSVRRCAALFVKITFRFPSTNFLTFSLCLLQ